MTKGGRTVDNVKSVSTQNYSVTVLTTCWCGRKSDEVELVS
jgi:hypothetical protein